MRTTLALDDDLLVASAKLTPEPLLWTRNKRLSKWAAKLNVHAAMA